MRALMTSLIALAVAVPAFSPAAAQNTRTYRVEARSEFWVDLNLCSPRVRIEAHGDDDTDVDFVIYDQNDNVAYQNYDLSDDMNTVLNPPAGRGRGCVDYRMRLNNLGNVWNGVNVTVTDLPGGGGGGGGGGNIAERTYRVEANSQYWVNLNMCSPRVWIEMQGDGDTDVDFTIYDTRNRVVHQNLDLTDYSQVTLNTPDRRRGCVTYRLRLNNLGNVWNGVTVRVRDVNR